MIFSELEDPLPQVHVSPLYMPLLPLTLVTSTTVCSTNAQTP